MAECSSKADHPTPTAAAAKNKWTCTCCTYMNWEASKKCVICHQPRNNRPMFIEELSAIENEDVATSLTVKNLSASSPFPDQNVYVDESRWPCPNCTYSNCRKTKRCAICSTNRPSPYGSDSSLNESSKSNQEAAKLVSKELLNKWSCSSCTFDNWPTASKCTICGNSNSSIPTQAVDKGQTNRTPSPKSSNDSERNQYKEEAERLGNLSIIDANKLTVTEQTKPADYTSALDIYVRRYLGNDPVEKLFFKAVRAIGHRELQMVNRVVDYLINDGNLQRALSSFEARLMNQYVSRSGNYKTVGFERVDSLFFLAKKSDCPDLLKLIRRVRDQEDKLPCALNCLTCTRLYTKVTQFLAIHDGASFKCQFIAHPHNFSILKLPMPETDDLALAVQTALFRPAPSIPPQFCFVDCYDSMASRGGLIIGRLPNFLMRNRGGANSLYDSVFQCMFGVCDRFDIIRAALKYTMHRSAHLFKIRWMEIQLKMARDCGLTAFTEEELDNDWEEVLSSIDGDDECPEPIHVWALSHVVCRPIIVQSMDDPIDVDQLMDDTSTDGSRIPDRESQTHIPEKQKPQKQANPHSFEGIYLPILWASPPAVTRSPLLLCYRNGQFSAVIVSDDTYQRDFEVQRYLRIRRSMRRPGVPEPLFRFLTRVEAENAAFLSQFILFGECSASQLSIRREAHPFMAESLALYRGWMHAILQAGADADVPCTCATMTQLETRIDAQQHQQKKWRNQTHKLFAPIVNQQQQNRQRPFAFIGRNDDGGNEQHQQHSDDE